MPSDVHAVRGPDIQGSGNAPQAKTIAFETDRGSHLMVLAWSAESFNDDVRSYPSKLTFPASMRPKTVTLTDVYWGVSQPAKWTYKNGRVTIDQVIVRDYPAVLTCE